jgi:hypothetical protein
LIALWFLPLKKETYVKTQFYTYKNANFFKAENRIGAVLFNHNLKKIQNQTKTRFKAVLRSVIF